LLCSVPQLGAIASAFAPAHDAVKLDAATARSLSTSKHTLAFIHVVFGLEGSRFIGGAQ
jgi:hypothetical protein